MSQRELQKNKHLIVESNCYPDMLFYSKQTNPLNFSEKMIQGLPKAHLLKLKSRNTIEFHRELQSIYNMQKQAEIDGEGELSIIEAIRSAED